MYTCSVCSKTFQKKSGLSQHHRGLCGKQLEATTKMSAIQRYDSKQQKNLERNNNEGKGDNDEDMIDVSPQLSVSFYFPLAFSQYIFNFTI